VIENKLASHTGHVSNFCGPNSTVIEPVSGQRFQEDSRRTPIIVRYRAPDWIRLELVIFMNERPPSCDLSPNNNSGDHLEEFLSVIGAALPAVLLGLPLMLGRLWKRHRKTVAYGPLAAANGRAARTLLSVPHGAPCPI
jgi:hypothetical protein